MRLFLHDQTCCKAEGLKDIEYVINYGISCQEKKIHKLYRELSNNLELIFAG